MKSIYNILVIIDPKHNNNPVLTRAKEFAKSMNASLHLLVCSESDRASELLSTLVSKLENEGIHASAEIAWNNSYHNTIVVTQKAQQSVLVIKTHLPDNVLKRVIITPEDWKLLRTCPCPILIVKQDREWANRPVLAAVDLGNPDKRHIALHEVILEVSEALTHVAEGSLHLISVYPSPIFSEIHPDSKIPGMTAEIKEIYTNACKKFEEKHARLVKENIHLVAGAADIVIPQIAKDLDASVCVIGTIARTGISGVLIGNTVEAILDDIECDILIIKPDSIHQEIELLIKQILSE